MGRLSAPRKRRNHPAIKKSSKIFSKCVENKDWKGASLIIFWTALKVGGVKGIMNTMEDAMSFLRRKKMRRGL